MNINKRLDEIISNHHSGSSWFQGDYEGYTPPDDKKAKAQIKSLLSEFVDEVINTPLRTGDRLKDDVIIEDGIEEAFFRTCLREKKEELLK